MTAGGERPSMRKRAEEGALAEGVLHFLASLGQRSEAELYLRVFRGLPPGQFAFVAPTQGVLREHAATLAEQIAFLRELGLLPSVVLGAVDLVSDELVESFEHALNEAGVSHHLIRSQDVKASSESVAGESVGLIHLPIPSDRELARLCLELGPRKIVFLRRAGGLGPHLGHRLELAPGHFLPLAQSGIGVINLRSDAIDLRRSELLVSGDEEWLGRAEHILTEISGVDARATVSIASPFSLLRELFTVRGEGTLIKRGASIERLEGLRSTQRDKVEELLTSAFGRRVKSEFWHREPLRVYLESELRGMALLEEGPQLGRSRVAFLSKFAVLPVARGEGLGQDLWWALSRETPSVYWRSRPENPISTWYSAVCDGMHRSALWNVYWRGVEPSNLARVIDDALGRPEDFEDEL